MVEAKPNDFSGSFLGLRSCEAQLSNRICRETNKQKTCGWWNGAEEMWKEPFNITKKGIV